MAQDDDLFVNVAKEMEENERRKKINTMIEENERERQNLEEKRKKAQKNYGEQQAPQMYRDVQELYSWVSHTFVAPEEAEAVCRISTELVKLMVSLRTIATFSYSALL